MNRKIKGIIGLMLFISLAVPGHAGMFEKKKTGPAEIPARPVETAVAASKDVPNYIDSFGNLHPLNNVDIKSQVTGQIESVHFTEGEEVSKGALLFSIDARPFKAALDKAQAALTADTATMELKKVTFERNNKLLEKGLISQQDFDTYRTDVESTEAQVNLDKANVELAKIELDYCSIISPINGRTGKRQVDPGNIVIANSGTTLVNIKTIDSLYMDFTIPETELDNVRNAMAGGILQVLISAAGKEDYSYSGQLQFFDNAVDNTTGTVMLRAIVNNKERSLWSGQFVNVRLILGIQKTATVVPYEAVQLGQSGSYLFVVDSQNKAELRLASTGIRYENDIVVNDGVKPGEKVVIVGQMGLAPGVKVADMSQKKPQDESQKGK